jgi:preprotein translocase subunit SecG
MRGFSHDSKKLSRLEVLKVAALRVAVTILYVLICLALVIVVLLQESRTQGLSGAVNGMAETYWGKNKGRSMEGRLEMITRIVTVLFIALSVVLNLNW